MRSAVIARRPLPRWTTALVWLLLLSVAFLSAGAEARAQADSSATTSADPRVGLAAGWMNAKEAARNLELVAHRDRPERFFNAANMGDFGFANADLAFSGGY